MSHKPVRVTISPSAPLLLALFVLLSSPVLLAALLFAALLHEMGHYVLLRCCGGRVTAIHITALGAEMQAAGRLSYGGELLAAAAGPVVNLIFAWLLAWLGGQWEVCYLFAGAQLMLGAFNLFPLPALDGGSILWNVAAWLTEPYTADRVTAVVGLGAAAVLTLAAAVALLLGGSPFFLLAAAVLLYRTMRQKGVAKPRQKRYNKSIS